jgi:divalent metal cation (Fe/Co/Zn/Cd) transporter
VRLVAVAFGQRWGGDPVAGLAVTLFICHAGYEVTKDVVHRLADCVEPAVITTAEAAVIDPGRRGLFVSGR